MKQTGLFFLLFFATFHLHAQEIPRIKAQQLAQWKTPASDSVYVLNFWATWCAPCVAELPEFEKLTRHFSAEKVKVILVSSDFRRDFETKLKPFVLKNGLKSQVVFMDEKTPNDWINLVHEDWSGALPATLIIGKQGRFVRFFEEPLTFEQLVQAVSEVLDKP